MKLSTDRQYELDVFRIVAILCIVMFHYTFRGFAADNYSILPFPGLGGVFKYGYLGVDVFLIISGYAMSVSSSSKGLKDFIVSRLLRLYPTFWIAVILISVATLAIGGNRFHVTPVQFFANLTMLNQFIGINSVDGAHWYLAVILRFYFIIAVVVVLKLSKYQEYLSGIWLLLALAITIFPVPKVGFIIMPQYAPFLVAGIIFASAKTNGWNLFKYGTVSISLLFSIYVSVKAINDFQQYYNIPLSIYAVASIILSLYIAFYLVSIRTGALKLPKVFILFSAATYPLFLIHQYIGYMIFNLLGEHYNKYVLLSMTVVTMLLISLLIAKYAEPYLYTKSKRALETATVFMTRIFRKQKNA
jgi:peptidoglycan/LPS O-acetylase OafA/YrhL